MAENIFGLRFGANAHLLPSKDEVEVFLGSLKKKGAPGTHGQDFTQYSELLRAVSAFERDRTNAADRDINESMFFGALSHSGFFTPALQSTVILYKFYLHALLSLDFRKPMSFIAAAEREIAGLDPKKKKEAEKLAKLRDLIDDRKRAVKGLERNRDDLIQELKNIVVYMRENLNRITRLCEKAIVLLVQLYTKEELRLPSDIKSGLSEGLQVIAALHDSAPEDNRASLSAAISSLLREDVYALSSLYEAMHDHTKAAVSRLDDLITGVTQSKGGDEELHVFKTVEEVLISLVSDLDSTFKRPSLSASAMLEQKREELVSSFLEYVRKERRARSDRRSGRERRRIPNPNYKGIENRSGKERRSGKSRRRS